MYLKYRLVTQDMRLAGKKFSVDRLEPFGEVWTPSKPLSMDEFLAGETRGDIAEIVQAVRKVGVAVIGDSSIGKDWRPVPTYPTDSIAGTVTGPYSDSVALQAKHAKEGHSIGNSYARPSDLVVAAKTNIQLLRGLVRSAPEDICEKYRLEELLERYEHPEAYYSFDFLDPSEQMSRDLGQMAQQLRGSLWIADQDLEEIGDQCPTLFQTFVALIKFYRVVSATSRQYAHNWSTHPNTTVLAYQDSADRFSDPDRVVHSFKTDLNTGHDQRPIHQEIVLGDSFRSESSYISFSEVLKRNRRF